MIKIRRNGLAAIKGDSYRQIEQMKKIFEERVDQNFYVVTDGSTALLSTSPEMEQDGLYIAFNGYLEDNSGVPEEVIASCYRRNGKDFIKSLNGSFRLILYDSEKEKLYASADKVGRKAVYYTDNTADLIVSSHLSPLLRHTQVDTEIDREAVSDFLQSWSVSFAGGKRLLKGVRRIDPSHILTYSNGYLNISRFWEVYNKWRDVSDREAVSKMDELLTEAAENLVQRVDDPLNVFLSGGFDSVFLTTLLSEVTDRTINTYTWGWEDNHFEDAQIMSEKLDTNHTSLKLDYTLPDRKDIWFYEEPHNAFVRYPFRELYNQGMRSYWTGLNSQATFPVCLNNIRKLDRAKWVEPILKRVNTRPIEDFVGENISYELSKGIAVLASPHHSAGIVNDWGLRNSHARRLISDDLKDSTRNISEHIDQKWGIKRLNYQDNYSYLQARIRDTARYAYYSQDMEHVDVFGYTPLLEYSYTLPMSQKKNRRLLQKIARGRVPNRIITKGASGWEFVSEQFRRKMAANRDLYEEKINRFLERGYLDPEPARELLLPDSFDGLTKGPVNQMIAVYLLEQWIETFIERETPWEQP